VKISIQSSAVTHLRAGFKFYEKKQEGLGVYFLECLYSDIDSLQFYAGIHPVQLGGFYRMLSKRFPHAVFYQIRENTIFVRAVVDLRRKPEWIERQLKRLPPE
jgi:hypothetical protein